MKLRTRIILLSSVAILLTVLICDIAFLAVYKNSILNDAFQNGYHQAYKVVSDFETYVYKTSSSRIDRIGVEYYFKSQNDDYTICVNAKNPDFPEEYYNRTVFSIDELIQYEKENIIESEKNEANINPIVLCSKFNWQEKTLFLYSGNIPSGFNLYHIVDITEILNKYNLITFAVIIISLSVACLAILILYLSLRHSFKPLQELSKNAYSIAHGAYDKRIIAYKSDEVGMLCEDFNKMAESVERHIKDVEESELKKTLFMGDLTHELKTPLTAISGYAQTMRSIKLSEDEKDEALCYIYEECKRLERLSKKMMRLLELDKNAQICLEDFYVSRLFDTVQKACTIPLKGKNITLQISDTTETLHADFDLICDVMINLIDNAIKASDENSQIKLYTQKMEDENFCIIVEDFGCGIPKDEQTKIFEPFYKVDKSRARKNGGSGLGLALSTLILKNHNMDFDIESDVNMGTKIVIYNSFKT